MYDLIITLCNSNNLKLYLIQCVQHWFYFGPCSPTLLPKYLEEFGGVPVQSGQKHLLQMHCGYSFKLLFDLKWEEKKRHKIMLKGLTKPHIHIVAAWTRIGFTCFSQNREGHLSKRSWMAGHSLTTSFLLKAKVFSIFSSIALSLFFFFTSFIKSSLSFSKFSSLSTDGSGGR